MLNDVAKAPTVGPAVPAYRYRATVLRVIDGDTLIMDVDLGFFTWVREIKIRLRGVDAWELTQPLGPEAREYTASLLATFGVPYGSVVIDSVKVDKYGGRWDAWVYLPDGRVLNTLVKEKYQKKPTGGGV